MSLVATEPSSEPNLDEFQTLPIHKSAREGKSGGGETLVLFQSESNICLHIYKWEIQECNVSSHILHAHGSLLGNAAPPAADFCNSYLDEWLKLNHSQQESHHSYLRKNGEAVIFWCITQHLACKQDTPPLLMTPRTSVPPFLLRCVPKDLLWVIDQVVRLHQWRHEGSVPTQQARQNTSACWSDVISKIEGTSGPIWLLKSGPSVGSFLMAS